MDLLLVKDKPGLSHINIFLLETRGRFLAHEAQKFWACRVAHDYSDIHSALVGVAEQCVSQLSEI